MKFTFAILALALVVAVSGQDFTDLARHAKNLEKEAKAMLNAIASGPHPERKALLESWNGEFGNLECANDGGCATYIQDAEGMANLRGTIAKIEAMRKLYNDIFNGPYCNGTSK